MRFLGKTAMDTQIANEAIKSGTLGLAMEEIMAKAQPEAAYFYEENGATTQILILNIDDASDLPLIAEPWWHRFCGTVEFHPVMVPGELEKAMQKMAG